MIFDWVITQTGGYFIVVAISGVILIVTTGVTLKLAWKNMISRWIEFYNQLDFHNPKDKP